MAFKTHEKEEKKLTDAYLYSIHYQSPVRDKPFHDTMDIMKSIFDASGQKHLLYLSKLRKLWFEKVDSFLARHSYPRNISVLNHFTISYELLEKCSQAGVSQEVLKHINGWMGEEFKSSEKFLKRLQNKLKKKLSPQDESLLKNQIRLIPKQTILHLTVYDGSIAQALRFETKAYLSMFFKLLPELRLDNLQCHVGNMGLVQADQRLVALLAKQWPELVPAETSQKSVPAYVHRVSEIHAVLILYVGSKEDMDFLKKYPGSQWLVEQLHQQIPESRNGIHQIAFVVKNDLNLQQTRNHSILLGNFPESSTAPANKDSVEPQPESVPPETISAKKEFAKINQELRKKL